MEPSSASRVVGSLSPGFKDVYRWSRFIFILYFSLLLFLILFLTFYYEHLLKIVHILEKTMSIFKNSEIQFSIFLNIF